MQQRQLRLGDILDDYCTRERRLTNHAVVAMVGDDVKQTRCTTCDTEHEYKHAKVPRQRRKADSPAALYAQVAAGAPKRVTAQSSVPPSGGEHDDDVEAGGGSGSGEDVHADDAQVTALAPQEEPRGDVVEPDEDDGESRKDEEGPVHRP